MYKFFAATAMLLTASAAAQAGAIPVKPGLWEMTSTMSMPMLPQPQVHSITECLEKEELSMSDVGTEGMDPNCTFESGQVDGDTMTWSFDCPVEGGGSSHGEWEATSHGDRVEGSGTVTMEMQGQAMAMTISWTGRRVGDCP